MNNDSRVNAIGVVIGVWGLCGLTIYMGQHHQALFIDMMIGMVAIVASALVFMVVYCVSEDWKNDRKRRGE